jgi:pimeloyl-ACP methyl ester carboxylesterase
VKKKSLNRRKFLKTTAATAGAGFVPVRPAGPAQTRVAIFLPGAMGTVLRNRAGTTLWSQDVFRIYETLVSETNSLQYPTVVLEPVEVLDRAYIQTKTVPIQVLSFYRRFIRLLLQHPDFKRPDGLLQFPYDWRSDINDLVRRLRELLASKYHLSYVNDRAQPHPDYQFDVIGHSLGGVTAFLSMYRQVIHPDNIRTLILIGTALRGSARPFQSFYDRATFPGLEGMNLIWWGKNRDKARARLQEVSRSFVSLYQVLPPRAESYINDESTGQWTNPLNDTVLPAPQVKAATALQDEIEKALTSFPIPQNRFHILYVNDLDTQFSFSVQKVTTGGSQRYDVLGRGGSTMGDGTVTGRSALYAANIASVAAPIIHAEHSEMCDDRQSLRLLESLLW